MTEKTVAVLPSAQSQIRAAAPSLPVDPVTDAAHHSEHGPALNDRSGITGKRVLDLFPLSTHNRTLRYPARCQTNQMGR